MTTTFPTTVDTSTQLYTAVNGISTTLSAAIDDAVTTIPVVDTTSFPSVGYVVIDTEIIKYTGKTGVTFTGGTRGADGSANVSHLINAPVYAYIVADHHNVLMGAIIAIEQNISDRFGVGATQIIIPAGSAAAPAICFSTGPDLDTGIYRIGADNLGIAVSGTKIIDVSSSRVDIGNALYEANGSAAIPSYTFASDIDTGIYRSGENILAFTCNGVQQGYFTTGTFAINQQLECPDGSAGTPSMSFWNDPNTGFYSEGANIIGISCNGAEILSIAATAFDPIGAGSVSSGTAARYWNDISYKTITDRGCLGSFDGGVEMPDGKVYADLEALSLIKIHPTKLTIYGKPMLDYKSFPVVSYKPADDKGVLLPRDENDEPVGGTDGAEMTSIFSIMIGAFKEINIRLLALEA